MTTLEAAEYLGVSAATLKRWRGKKEGPEYMRLGERIIRYRSSDLDRWLLQARTH
jgi:excisionase family DNA binding protein